MRELLIVMATIADQPDIELVGESWNESDMANIVEQGEPTPQNQRPAASTGLSWQ
jgi:hypothetical protein